MDRVLPDLLQQLLSVWSLVSSVIPHLYLRSQNVQPTWLRNAEVAAAEREREREREKNLLPNPRELIIKPRLNGSDYLSLPEL